MTKILNENTGTTLSAKLRNSAQRIVHLQRQLREAHEEIASKNQALQELENNEKVAPSPPRTTRPNTSQGIRAAAQALSIPSSIVDLQNQLDAEKRKNQSLQKELKQQAAQTTQQKEIEHLKQQLQAATVSSITFPSTQSLTSCLFSCFNTG